ncbi:MAG: hemopexin repeat-containing protein [Bacteroidota bacterium]
MKFQPFIFIYCLFVYLPLIAQNDKEPIQAAILSPHNGEGYFFVRNKVYQYNAKTQKRKIRNLGSNAFRGVPTEVDAALVDPGTGKAYIFKGNTWYRFHTSQGKLEKRGLLGTGDFPGLEGPFHGAVRHGGSDRYAFFKGKTVFIYDPQAKKVVHSGPFGVGPLYTGVPTSPDAVVQWNTTQVYFLKGDHYHLFDFTKSRVVQIGVINRDSFKKLFPRIDAAFCHSGHPVSKYRGSKAFLGNSYYEAPDESGKSFFNTFATVRDPNILALSVMQNDKFFKQTTYGLDHFEGVLPKVDAALEHFVSDIPYFLKGSKFYRYNHHTRKVDDDGTLSQGWDGLPSDIDAAYSAKDGYHYFFKEDRYYRYNYNSKRLESRSGLRIKDTFRGVPNYLDAAIWTPKYIYFYKKRTEYVYDHAQKRVMKWNTIDKIAK